MERVRTRDSGVGFRVRDLDVLLAAWGALGYDVDRDASGTKG
jgi:hypothetical protein